MSETRVRQFITELGLSTLVIPVNSPEKRADVYIPDDKGLVEVKSNEDLKLEQERLRREGAVTRSIPQTYSNAINAIIKDASSKQSRIASLLAIRMPLGMSQHIPPKGGTRL